MEGLVLIFVQVAQVVMGWFWFIRVVERDKTRTKVSMLQWNNILELIEDSAPSSIAGRFRRGNIYDVFLCQLQIILFPYLIKMS